MTAPETSGILDVVCLVLIDSHGSLLAARRPVHKSLGGLWELPGGKMDPGEPPEDALRRELREELDLTVGPLEALPCHTHPYEFATIRLWPMLARCDARRRPQFTLHEHTEVRWVDARSAESLAWAPADLPVLKDVFSRG